MTTDLDQHFEDKVYELFFINGNKLVTKQQISFYLSESITSESALTALDRLIDKGLVIELVDMLEITEFDGDHETGTRKESLYKAATPHEIATKKSGKDDKQRNR